MACRGRPPKRARTNLRRRKSASPSPESQGDDPGHVIEDIFDGLKINYACEDSESGSDIEDKDEHDWEEVDGNGLKGALDKEDAKDGNWKPVARGRAMKIPKGALRYLPAEEKA